MVLFNKIKYGPLERDHGFCFENPVVISLSTHKGKSKNIDDASRGVADQLSTRKDNDIILFPTITGLILPFDVEYNKYLFILKMIAIMLFDLISFVVCVEYINVGLIDMKSDTCYYLDSLSSSNFNMQLKQIVDL
ncbi:unnamed protein product [Lactuca saligna]|uniref:Uncharacterized protein n=1 Tax=Lactuca saligna TaxID=75948 RepID=A0AA35Z7X6_LACSI|nr:unnamed protein product [Lactuca saligna]